MWEWKNISSLIRPGLILCVMLGQLLVHKPVRFVFMSRIGVGNLHASPDWWTRLKRFNCECLVGSDIRGIRRYKQLQWKVEINAINDIIGSNIPEVRNETVNVGSLFFPMEAPEPQKSRQGWALLGWSPGLARSEENETRQANESSGDLLPFRQVAFDPHYSTTPLTTHFLIFRILNSTKNVLPCS